MNRFLFPLFGPVGLVCGLLPASAAPIIWSPAVAPASELDVLTGGTLVTAWNCGDRAAATLAGQPFAATPAGPGNVSMRNASLRTESGRRGLDQMLASHSSWQGSPGSSFSFEFTGLTIGHRYRVQLWPAHDTRSCRAARRQRFGDGEVPEHFTAYLRRDSAAAVTGEFVADAVFQRVTVNSHPDFGNIDPGLSGLQLRDLGPVKDTDRDGIPDDLEDRNPPLDKNDPADAALDFDGDGLPNRDEILCGTSLLEIDTDRDGLLDGDEIFGNRNPYRGGSKAGAPGEPTDPLEPDSDLDGLTDWEEVSGSRNGAFQKAPTDPNSPDTDGDDYPDGSETNLASNPLDPFSQPSELFWTRADAFTDPFPPIPAREDLPTGLPGGFPRKNSPRNRVDSRATPRI